MWKLKKIKIIFNTPNTRFHTLLLSSQQFYNTSFFTFNCTFLSRDIHVALATHRILLTSSFAFPSFFRTTEQPYNKHLHVFVLFQQLDDRRVLQYDHSAYSIFSTKLQTFRCGPARFQCIFFSQQPYNVQAGHDDYKIDFFSLLKHTIVTVISRQ